MRTVQTAAALMATLFFLYVATARAYFVYGDDIQMYYVAQSIVERGDFSMPLAGPANAMVPGIVGRDGRRYSWFGIGQSLAAIPFYALGKITAPLIDTVPVVDKYGNVRTSSSTFALFLLNAAVSASICATFLLVVVELGGSQRTAAFLGIVLGVGTMIWHYSTMFLSEPLTGLGIIVSIYALVTYSRRAGRIRLAASGFALGMAVATRSMNAILVIPFLVYLLLTGRQDPRKMLRSITIWFFPVLAWAGVIGYYNYARFGSALESGYGRVAFMFNTPLLTGAYGLLLSPGRGVLEYNPALILALVGGVVFWNRTWWRTPAVWLAASVAGTYIILYSLWFQWWGGGVWGPRFLVPVIPLLLLGAVPLVEEARASRTRFAIAVCFAVSAFIQIVSVVVPFDAYYQVLGGSAEAFAESLWEPAYSPIYLQARIFLSGHFVPAFAFVIYHSRVLLLVQVASAVAFLGASVVLVSCLRSVGAHVQAPEASSSARCGAEAHLINASSSRGQMA